MSFRPEPEDFDPRSCIEQMPNPAIWLLGEEDRIIPAPASAAIVRDIADRNNREFTAIVYPGLDHGLRPPGSR